MIIEFKKDYRNIHLFREMKNVYEMKLLVLSCLCASSIKLKSCHVGT